MKITIITFQAHHNYGAMLQAYALQDYLKSAGYESRFLNFVPPYIEAGNRKIPKVRSLKTFLKFCALFPFRRALETRYRRFEDFREQQLPQGEPYSSYEDLKAAPPKTDVYLCGSDQIWNLQQGGNPVYFLRFLSEKVPALTYAASFGTDSIPSDLEDDFKEWQMNYDHLSVRESPGVELAKRLTNREITHVVDPIFLKTREEWANEIGERLMPQPYLAFYSLETSKWISTCVRKIAKVLGLKIVILGKPGNLALNPGTKLAIDSGPSEFVSWIHHADFVVSNSFHAAAFASYFERPLAIVPHSSRNARMESLLELLQEQSKMLTMGEELSEERINALSTGVGEEGRAALERSQKISKDYLLNSLSDLGIRPRA